jgi:hypothetical protein
MAQCEAEVFVRDTFRRTGRGTSGFEMHYRRRRCRRTALRGQRMCWQHRHVAPPIPLTPEVGAP